jgi:hypothetical protein
LIKTDLLIKINLLTKELHKNPPHQDLLQTEILIFKTDKQSLREKRQLRKTLHKVEAEGTTRILLISIIYHHLKHFNQRPMMNSSSSVLPPLFAHVSPSNTSGQQVKILLEENQILSLHLNEKM